MAVGTIMFANPPQLLHLILLALGAILFCAWWVFGLMSAIARQSRAARRALALGVATSFPYFVVVVIWFPYHDAIGWGLLLLTAAFGIVCLFPKSRLRPWALDLPSERHDRRDTILQRVRLQPGTHKHEDYYARHPEHAQFDDSVRTKWGRCCPRSGLYYHARHAATYEAGFFVAAALRDTVDGLVNPDRTDVPPVEITHYIKNWAQYLGAHSVGVALLQPYSIYGIETAPIARRHKYVIAFTVEMKLSFVSCAPEAAASVESTEDYVTSAVIAVQLAAFIRKLGYPARAHIVRNDEVICPLVARDAGLGEIGRMGLLITPDLGPRVRIAAVTTDLPLVVDTPKPFGAVAFCESCTKCADCCPSKAIPCGDQGLHAGVKRWKIDHNACFGFWNTSGGFCGRCMAVCPYSHPNTLPHKIMRYAVRGSGVGRKVAIALDDFVYGSHPAPGPMPDWLNVKE